jgi:hypothetical protein
MAATPAQDSRTLSTRQPSPFQILAQPGSTLIRETDIISDSFFVMFICRLAVCRMGTGIILM